MTVAFYAYIESGGSFLCLYRKWR